MEKWRENCHSDTGRVHTGFSTPEYWDRAAAGYDRNKGERHSRKTEKTIALFKNNDLLSKASRVLEIGCGTGTLARALAAEGCDVTAIDFSEKMIERCIQDTSGTLQKRISFVLCDWDTVDISAAGWERGFDLVIAFMSPAVSSPESLFKMMAASRKGCAIKSWAASRKHTILDALWAVIMDRPLEDKPRSFFYKINLLFAMGYFPEITFDRVEWTETITVEAELENQLSFFKTVSDSPPETLEQTIRRHLNTMAADGHLTKQHRGVTGTAVWQIASLGGVASVD